VSLLQNLPGGWETRLPTRAPVPRRHSQQCRTAGLPRTRLRPRTHEHYHRTNQM